MDSKEIKMKKLLIGLMLVSTSTFAGTIDVTINPLDNIPLNLDRRLEVRSASLALNCHWLRTPLQAITPAYTKNDFTTNKIDVSIKQDEDGFSLSTDSKLDISEFRFMSNYKCYAELSIDLHSKEDPSQARNFLFDISLDKTSGDLTNSLIENLRESRIRAEFSIASYIPEPWISSLKGIKSKGAHRTLKSGYRTYCVAGYKYSHILSDDEIYDLKALAQTNGVELWSDRVEKGVTVIKLRQDKVRKESILKIEQSEFRKVLDQTAGASERGFLNCTEVIDLKY